MRKALAVLVFLVGSTPALAGANTAVVALAGGNYTDPVSAMNDVATWCGTPSAANPCLLKIMPGVFDLGANGLQMQAYVDVEGAGENVTRVRGSADVVISGAPSGPADLRSLTIENYGSGFALNLGGWISMEQTVSRVTMTSPSGYGVNLSFASGAAATVILKDVRITTANWALWCTGNAALKVQNSDVRTTAATGETLILGTGDGNTICSASLANVSVYSEPQGTALSAGGPVDIRDSTVNGPAYFGSTAKVVNSLSHGAVTIAGTTKIENTELTGPFTRQGSGQVLCRANFDSNLNAFGCPTWR